MFGERRGADGASIQCPGAMYSASDLKKCGGCSCVFYDTPECQSRAFLCVLRRVWC
jgi:ferredoxin-thioredoxin reductase catalytic subunit